MSQQLNRINYLLNDMMGWNLLRPLLEQANYLPMTAAAINPFSLACILNDIVINKRLNILEFGSGISTILIGRLIRLNGLKSKIISIEHDLSWFKEMKDTIEREGLQESVKIILSPLKEEHGIYWYDKHAIEDKARDILFDSVIIDGPPAWEEGKEKARQPAFGFLINKLSENYIVFLDDANRAGEQQIIMDWTEKYSVNFNSIGPSLAYTYKGKIFSFHPL